MTKRETTELRVNGQPISIRTIDDRDYISLTDMMKASDGTFFLSDWLRNANTLDYLAAWESLYNPRFNYGEFAIIRSHAGSNSFKISFKEWTEKTGAIGLRSIPGRYGGTYAHKDIAFHFGMWISPEFQLYIVREYQRLKTAEQNALSQEWDARRELAKTNYALHTDAVKRHLLRPDRITPSDRYKYAEEADLINLALFGQTAKEWQNENPQRYLNGENVRDSASINELIVLSNLESMNATLISKKIDKRTRFLELSKMAREQLTALSMKNELKSIKKLSALTYLDAETKDKKTDK